MVQNRTHLVYPLRFYGFFKSSNFCSVNLAILIINQVENKTSAMIKLNSLIDTYLLISKNVDPEALRRCGRSVGEINSFGLSSNEAFKVTLELLNIHVNRFDKKDKMHFVAYNAGFDTDFVREWFLKNSDNYYGSYFFHPSICVMQAMAWFTQSVRGVLPNFQLGTMCKCAELGWDEAQSHDATYDITKTMELYAYLREQSPVL
jgi:hypothetical protein